MLYVDNFNNIACLFRQSCVFDIDGHTAHCDSPSKPVAPQKICTQSLRLRKHLQVQCPLEVGTRATTRVACIRSESLPPAPFERRPAPTGHTHQCGRDEVRENCLLSFGAISLVRISRRIVSDGVLSTTKLLMEYLGTVSNKKKKTTH